jgi:hypothetical protein
MNEDKLTDFCEKYEARIIDESGRYPRLDYEFFLDPKNKDYVDTRQSGTEPLYILQIPASRLNELINIERIFFNNISNIGHRRMFQAWLAMKIKEKELQVKYQTVKTAYEEYSLILNLVRDEKLDIDDIVLDI